MISKIDLITASDSGVTEKKVTETKAEISDLKE